MTTIAFRDGVMAADSMTIDDNGIKSLHSVKLFEVDGAIIGVCGIMEHAFVFVDWYKDRQQLLWVRSTWVLPRPSQLRLQSR